MYEEQTVPVQAGDVTLEGDLVIPDGATGIVLFAHGSGSSRHSSRNRFVANALQAAAQLQAEHQVKIIPGATHLFEKPGALEQVARLAAGWFSDYLSR